MDHVDVQRSYLKIIKKGLSVKEINSLESPKINQIYCFKKTDRDPHHRIVVLCLNGKTVLLTTNSTSAYIQTIPSPTIKS